MLEAIVLAAGSGTRMKSENPKVLHEICGIPMIAHVLRVLEETGTKTPVAVIGYGAEKVRKALDGYSVTYALQTERLGTGHAVMQAAGEISEGGTVLVVCGDTPLIRSDSLKKFLECHEKNGYAATVLTTTVDQPHGYGRIVRNEAGELLGIVEEKDASDEERKLREINSGMYCFKSSLLKEALKEIGNNNSQGEYYLTDVIGILRRKGFRAGAFEIKDFREILGVNNRVQLALADEILQGRIQERHMLEGVTIVSPSNTRIESNVRIGADTILLPGSHLRGETAIGSGCEIGPYSILENTRVGDGTRIRQSTVIDSIIGEDAQIGPYAYLRPDSRIGNGVKIGDFVEIKNSTVGDGSKASHLAYIGDADVGKGVNISCGVVFVNYDGRKKHRTAVGDHSFIGCNVNLVAPVTVGERAYVAAGTTITENVPEGALSIGRSRQENKENWVDRKWSDGSK